MAFRASQPLPFRRKVPLQGNPTPSSGKVEYLLRGQRKPLEGTWHVSSRDGDKNFGGQPTGRTGVSPIHTGTTCPLPSLIHVASSNNERARARVYNWRRLCRLGQKTCQKAEESFNGLKAESATMHSRTCMVGLRNLHGWTSQLAWLDFATSMVQLLRFHPLTEKDRSEGLKTAV